MPKKSTNQINVRMWRKYKVDDDVGKRSNGWNEDEGKCGRV
jgi:hypothetical protein